MKIAFQKASSDESLPNHIPMAAQCFEYSFGKLYLHHSIQLEAPYGAIIESSDVVWDHPEYPDYDGFYTTPICDGRDLIIHTELELPNLYDIPNASVIGEEMTEQ